MTDSHRSWRTAFSSLISAFQNPSRIRNETTIDTKQLAGNSITIDNGIAFPGWLADLVEILKRPREAEPLPCARQLKTTGWPHRWKTGWLSRRCWRSMYSSGARTNWLGWITWRSRSRWICRRLPPTIAADYCTVDFILRERLSSMK